MGSVLVLRLFFRLWPLSAVRPGTSGVSESPSRFRLVPIDIGVDLGCRWMSCKMAGFFFLTLRGFGAFGPLFFFFLGGSACWAEAGSLSNSDSAGRSAASSAFTEVIINKVVCQVYLYWTHFFLGFQSRVAGWFENHHRAVDINNRYRRNVTQRQA